MEKILVSDAGEHSARIAYIYNALSACIPATSPRPRIFIGETRSAIAVDERLITTEVTRKMRELFTEVIAIGCKYAYLSARLPLEKLTLRERKIFLCALISADLFADKKYIYLRLQEVDSCALDGFFSFRLHALKHKWDKIIGYIPPDFSKEELERFMSYLVDGNTGKAYVREGEVYDGKYLLCHRSQLVGATEELRLETEIILSCAGEVHIAHPLLDRPAGFLRKYYGARAVFHEKN